MLASMAILSIQSAVAYGSVGNAAAVFPLERLGFEVWRVDTVLFSNHTGYGTWRGAVLDPGLVGEILTGIEERGVFSRCEAVLSGYLATAALGHLVLDSVARVKRANGKALYLCDPVMGDRERGLFVKAELPDFYRTSAIPAADILTPNHFELEALAGRRVATLAEALGAAQALRDRGPSIILVTSLTLADAPADRIAMLAATSEGAWRVSTPRLPIAANGAGDLTAALFLAHVLKTRDAAVSLAATASAVHGVLEKTLECGALELAIVAAQEALVAPPHHFSVERIG